MFIYGSYALIIESGILHCLYNGTEIDVPKELVDIGNNLLKLYREAYNNKKLEEWNNLHLQVHNLLEEDNDIEKIK